MSRERVVIAMSGGVDSSVAAALLKEQGYEVAGITMCFNLADSVGRRPNCCGQQGIEDARRVAYKLGIKHYVINMKNALEEWVINDFLKEYLLGRTPNPCVRCNQYIKFDALLRKTLVLGAKYLATGHYAKIEEAHRSKRIGHSYLLKKARDKNKDQSYFLYRLNQNQLKHILFPLGDYLKSEVRALARKFQLPVADKPGSQEICFVPDADYRKFLKNNIAEAIKPGNIVDTKGNLLGRHRGIAFYTIGQREGLGIAKGYPLYITEINAKKNQITLGPKRDTLKKEFLLKDMHFINQPLKKKVACGVRIRYNHKEANAEVISQGKKIKVHFKKPQFAITPGQSAVFYKNNTVLGGGIIKRVLG